MEGPDRYQFRPPRELLSNFLSACDNLNTTSGLCEEKDVGDAMELGGSRKITNVQTLFGILPEREKNMTDVRDAQLSEVAYWYYVKGEGLSAIANRMGRSISMASRMLKEARKRGLVDVRINYPFSRATDLEEAIEAGFNLNKAYVFAHQDAATDDVKAHRFGSFGASTVEGLLSDAPIVSVGWGSQVFAIVDAVRSSDHRLEGLVVQSSGASATHEDAYDGARVTQLLADRLGRPARLMFSPLFVETPQVAEALRNSETVAQTLDCAQKADLALISVGTPYSETAGLRRAGYLSDNDVTLLKKAHSVGDLMGYHLDRDGNVLDIDLNQRIVGLMPCDLARIGHVVVAATGSAKAPAILAALRGGYVDTLLTDRETAVSLLQIDTSKAPKYPQCV